MLNKVAHHFCYLVLIAAPFSSGALGIETFADEVCAVGHDNKMMTLYYTQDGYVLQSNTDQDYWLTFPIAAPEGYDIAFVDTDSGFELYATYQGKTSISFTGKVEDAKLCRKVIWNIVN